jgi:parallel beta-helix repeat protein
LEGGEGGGAAYSGLGNCVIVNNTAADNGGGVYGSSLDGCRLSGNSAANSGGGASGSGLNNCVLENNFAAAGGGVAQSGLNNSTLSGNLALTSGGGATDSTLNNCIVYYNSSTNGLNFLNSGLNYCCTTPLPTNGVANFTNAPLFVDMLNVNFHLQTNSPCINSGLNAYAPGAIDFDGSTRIAGGTVDVGAYELQSPASILSYVWAQQFGLATDGSADFMDADGDGLNNWAEWHTGTNPTNALSVLTMMSPSHSVSGTTVQWQSVAGVDYFIERSTNLAAHPAFETLVTDIIADTSTTSYTDETTTNSGPYFYRVGVQ